jgi:peptidyl-prolyl cis-trans isomerase SurA
MTLRLLNLDSFAFPRLSCSGTALLATSALAQTRRRAAEPLWRRHGRGYRRPRERPDHYAVRLRPRHEGDGRRGQAARRHHAGDLRGHKDLLRSLIDQQLWLSKGKELGINGETELIKRLDEIRKQYNLETLQDLEKAAKEQGVSFEDFKANIRNQIITQLVMREEVSRKVQFTQGEVSATSISTSRSTSSRRACS